MSLLEVERIKKRFGGVHAVDGVSLRLESGEFAALIGPNGAGKSTLFALIAGQQEADGGRVLFAGRDISRIRPVHRTRRGLGRTFQTALAFASMTVSQNVQLALTARAGRHVDPWRPLWRQHEDAARALLARVGLDALAQQAAADLAYADVKRLELAVALAGAPRLLLMDEPTAGMAPGERLALMDLVGAIAADSGLTVLFTEHSMDVVFGYARRLLVMSRGVLIADGGPDAVRADPAVQAAYFGDAPTR
jgi:ABC-type branched-subunit amino acid transport system ATPase component